MENVVSLAPPSGAVLDPKIQDSIVLRGDLSGLNEGQKISYEVEKDRRTGKESAGQLKAPE